MNFNRFIMYSLKRGMILSVSIPMLVALVSSSIMISSELQQYSRANRAAEMKDLVGSMSALMHEQQKERGATSIYLSSKGTQFGSELSTQRAVTDQAAESFLRAIELHGQSGGADISASLSSIAAVLETRQALRQLVDDLQVETPAALGHYTQHNAALLSTIASIGSFTNSPRVALKVTSLEALLAAKEFSGIERAIGAGGFAVGSFDIERLRHLERLVTRQNDSLGRFITFAEPSFREEVEAIGRLDATQELERMRQIAFSSFATGDLKNTSESEFFAAATIRIDALKSVEDRLVDTISDTANDIARQSLAIVVALASGVVLAAVISAGMTTYVIRHMLKAVRRIANAGDRLAKGDETAELPNDSPKELGRVVWSINFFKESVSEAKEREAQELQKKQDLEKAAQQEEQERQLEEKERAEQEALSARQEQKQMQEYVSEVSTIVSACAAGDFSRVIDLDGKDGVFREIGEGLNTLVRSVDEGLSAAGGALERVARGDLATQMDGEFKGVFKDLQRDTNSMIGALRELIVEINGSTVNLSSSSSELRDTSDDLSRQAEQSAASLEQTSAALEELSSNIAEVDKNVSEANKNARTARETAQQSGAVASDAAEAMTKISEASKEIANVVTAIDDISFQINLLALNAGVEAARAGDAGRGFSVVASEVRQLAQRAGEAATEIEDVISRSDLAVAEGVSKVQNAQQSFEKISTSVVSVSERIERVSHAISEQVTGITEITNAVAQIDGNTQKQAAAFEEVTAASTLLSKEAQGLAQSTSRFRTGVTTNSARTSDVAAPSEKTVVALKTPSTGTTILAAKDEEQGWAEF